MRGNLRVVAATRTGRKFCTRITAVTTVIVAGLYPDVFAVQKTLSAGAERIHIPDPERVKVCGKLYEKYGRLGKFIEGERL